MLQDVAEMSFFEEHSSSHTFACKEGGIIGERSGYEAISGLMRFRFMRWSILGSGTRER